MKRRSQQLKNIYPILVEHSREIVLFFDMNGRVVACNQCANYLLGYQDDIYNTLISDIFRKAISAVNKQVIIHHKFQNNIGETVSYRKDETCFPVELKVLTGIRDKSFYGVCIANDVSEKCRYRRELNITRNKLKACNKVKNEFVANISHELRTPVNGIMGLTEYLLDIETDNKHIDTLRLIHRCCSNMKGLISDLLDFVKIGHNKLILEKQEFEFRRFINDIVKLYQGKILDKGLKLVVNIAEDIPEIVVGDERRLSQVISNLMSNAIKFTFVGQITLDIVKSMQSTDEVELFFMVIDTGIGISQEDMDKLFVSFSQVDSSITRRFGGTGLGLFISRLLVEAMGGVITVDSKKDKGSTFLFSIPLGISEGIVNTKEKEPIEYHVQREFDINHSDILWESSTEYLDGLLQEYDDYQKDNLTYKSIDRSVANETFLQKILSISEKLRLCIEMENWIKAEETATALRKMIHGGNEIIKKEAFKLLLSIRKEEISKSLEELKHFDEMIKEVELWNI